MPFEHSTFFNLSFLAFLLIMATLSLLFALLKQRCYLLLTDQGMTYQGPIKKVEMPWDQFVGIKRR